MKKGPQKQQVNFNEYWSVLKRIAAERGKGKGEFMRMGGINYKRYSEFDNGTRDISPNYFIKLIGGLGLKPKDIEEKSGKKFTKEQRDALGYQAWLNANESVLKALYRDPEMPVNFRSPKPHLYRSDNSGIRNHTTINYREEIKLFRDFKKRHPDIADAVFELYNREVDRIENGWRDRS